MTKSTCALVHTILLEGVVKNVLRGIMGLTVTHVLNILLTTFSVVLVESVTMEWMEKAGVFAKTLNMILRTSVTL